MTQIVLSDDQIQVVRHATDTVEIRDRTGVLLGYIARQPTATSEEIAEARRRLNSNGPWHTTAEVLEHLHAQEQQ